MDSSEAAEIFLEIVTFMEMALHMPIPEGMRSVPVLAVDLQSLNENRDKACTATHGRYRVSFLCPWSSRRTVYKFFAERKANIIIGIVLHTATLRFRPPMCAG